MKSTLLVLMLLLAAGAWATVPNVPYQVTFTCTGSVGPFPFTFPIYDPTAMTVVVGGVVQPTSAYTIAPVNNNYNNGGKVTLNSACTTSLTLLLKRDTPITQTIHFYDNMPIPMTTFERSLDKLTEIAQELQGQITASGTIPSTFNVLMGDGTGGALASTMLDDLTNPVESPHGLSTMSDGLYNNAVPNDSTGTTANLAACVNSSGKVYKCLTTDTSGIAGVATQGAGITGSPQICTTICNPVFDNQTTAGHWAVLSTTVAGEFHDTGLTTKTEGQQNVFVIAANTGAGTQALVEVLTPDVVSGGGGGGGGGGTSIKVNGTLLATPFGNFNNTTPAAGSNGKNVAWQMSAGNISAELVGNGNAATYLDGTGAYTTPPSGTGTVTSITATTPVTVTPSPLTTTGVISLDDTAVTPGSYTNTNLTVDAKGRITAAANGSGGTSVNVNGSSVSSPNFNGTTPAASSNGKNVTWQVSGSSVSAEIVGDGSASHYLDGTGAYTSPSFAGSTYSASITDIAPVSGDAILILDPPAAVTLTRFYCGVQAATSVVVDLKVSTEGAIGTLGSSVLSGTVTATTSGALGSISTPALGTHIPLVVSVGTVTGTVGHLYCALEYTR